jgi:hypothetical protein
LRDQKKAEDVLLNDYIALMLTLLLNFVTRMLEQVSAALVQALRDQKEEEDSAEFAWQFNTSFSS